MCTIFSCFMLKRKISIHNGVKSMQNRLTFLFLFTCIFTRFFFKTELTTICIIVRFKMMIKNAAKNIFILDYGLRLSCHSDTFWWNNFLIIILVQGTRLVFCYQNCSDLLWEKTVLVIEKNFWNSRLKAKNLQKFWDH